MRRKMEIKLKNKEGKRKIVNEKNNWREGREKYKQDKKVENRKQENKPKGKSERKE